MTTILIVLLIVLLIGAFPAGAAYNSTWGYGPSSVIGIILVVLLVLMLLGRI